MTTPSPDKEVSPPARKSTPQSISGYTPSSVRAHREGGFTPGEGEFPFQICADLVTDEIKEAEKWERDDQIKVLPPDDYCCSQAYLPVEGESGIPSRYQSHPASGAKGHWIKVLG